MLLSGARSRAGDDQPKPLTQHDVLPIVLLRCTTCHGARIKEAGVDLRTPAAMKRGGKNGPALLPGDPDGSLMIQRIESEACPPREKLLKFFVRRPSASEVEKLRRWIEEGAQEFDIRPDVATSEPDRWSLKKIDSTGRFSHPMFVARHRQSTSSSRQS